MFLNCYISISFFVELRKLLENQMNNSYFNKKKRFNRSTIDFPYVCVCVCVCVCVAAAVVK